MIQKAFALLFFLSLQLNPASEIAPVTTIEMEKEALLNKERIYDIIETNEGCKILKFNVLWWTKGKDVVEIPNPGDTLTARSKQLIGRSAAGDLIYLDKIDSFNDCLQYQKTGATSFVIQIK